MKELVLFNDKNTDVRTTLKVVEKSKKPLVRMAISKGIIDEKIVLFSKEESKKIIEFFSEALKEIDTQKIK